MKKLFFAKNGTRRFGDKKKIFLFKQEIGKK